MIDFLQSHQNDICYGVRCVVHNPLILKPFILFYFIPVHRTAFIFGTRCMLCFFFLLYSRYHHKQTPSPKPMLHQILPYYTIISFVIYTTHNRPNSNIFEHRSQVFSTIDINKIQSNSSSQHCLILISCQIVWHAYFFDGARTMFSLFVFIFICNKMLFTEPPTRKALWASKTQCFNGITFRINFDEQFQGRNGGVLTKLKWIHVTRCLCYYYTFPVSFLCSSLPLVFFLASLIIYIWKRCAPYFWQKHSFIFDQNIKMDHT